MRARALAAALVLTAAAGCALDEAPRHEEVLLQALPVTTSVPPAWSTAASADPVAENWLASLDDPLLEALVLEAMSSNPDLRLVAERVTIAQQSIIVVGAALLPRVEGQLGALTTRAEHESGYNKVSSAFAAVGWEVDLWGRLRAQRAASEASADVTALDYVRARQSLAATVAKAWYLNIEARQLLELSEQSVEIYEELLDLVSARRQAGRDSDLDVFDTRAKVQTSRSEVQSALQRFDEARRALETLLGRYPAAEIAVAADYPTLRPPPAAGLPAALLDRRPDVVAAERNVLAAFRREEAAKLALLPDISITLLGGKLGSLTDSLENENPWIQAAGIGVSIPIYEGGSLLAQIEIASAQEAQAVAAYGSVVLAAFREVEDALENERLLANRLPLDESALQDRIETVRIATEQYQAGRQDLLWVSNLQTSQIGAAASLIKLRSLQRVNRIQLLLALGGSFLAAPAEAAPGSSAQAADPEASP